MSREEKWRNWCVEGTKVRCLFGGWHNKLGAKNPQAGLVYTIETVQAHPLNPDWWGITLVELPEIWPERERKEERKQVYAILLSEQNYVPAFEPAEEVK